MKLQEIQFGNYLQQSTYSKEPITWIVLSSENSELVLLSKSILSFRRYGKIGQSWGNSELRGWLNNKFYNEAFSERDKEAMVPIPTDTRSVYEKDLLETSVDYEKVSLLSYKQAEELREKRTSSELDENKIFYSPQITNHAKSQLKPYGEAYSRAGWQAEFVWALKETYSHSGNVVAYHPIGHDVYVEPDKLFGIRPLIKINENGCLKN